MPYKPTTQPCARCGTVFTRARRYKDRALFCAKRCAALASAQHPPLGRIWDKTVRQGECWLWAGARLDAGYGYLEVDGKRVLAHRVSYELTYGPIPPGLVIDHLCRMPQCINPAHLEAVTWAENIARGKRWARARAELPLASRRSHCRACRRSHDVTY